MLQLTIRQIVPGVLHEVPTQIPSPRQVPMLAPRSQVPTPIFLPTTTNVHFSAYYKIRESDKLRKMPTHRQIAQVIVRTVTARYHSLARHPARDDRQRQATQCAAPSDRLSAAMQAGLLLLLICRTIRLRQTIAALNHS